MTYRPLPEFLTIDKLYRTPLGGFINHSEEPNAKIAEVQRVRYLYFLRDIQDGEEITVKYSMYDPTQLS
jgi:SET domain-containing protein